MFFGGVVIFGKIVPAVWLQVLWVKSVGSERPRIIEGEREREMGPEIIPGTSC